MRIRFWYAPFVSESEERIETERCCAGTRNDALAWHAADLWRSDEARRRALSRGGMVVLFGGLGTWVAVMRVRVAMLKV